MKERTDHEVLVEFRQIQKHLSPILNDRSREVLKEIERRLSVKGDVGIGRVTDKSSRMTKEQILNKWLNKY